MNRECNGDFYHISYQMFYRCLWDGTVVTAHALKSGKRCPVCSRVIDGTYRERVKTRSVQQVQIDGRWLDHRVALKAEAE